LDIRSAEILKIFEKEEPDIVDHHAAHVNVRHSVDDPIYDGDVNILGSLNLLEAAVKTGVKHFIYASSGGAVYGEPEYLPCDEEHPIRPISPYGASKYIVELHLAMYQANYGLPYTILRYPNVYGPRQDPSGEAGVVSIFAELLLDGGQVEIYGNGEQVRDFLFVKDCARANLYVLDSLRVNEVFNLGSGHGTSINEIYSMLSSLSNHNGAAVYSPERVGETRRIYLNPVKAFRLLRWRPVVSLELGLEETVGYYRKSKIEGRVQLVPTVKSEIVQKEQDRILLPKQYDLDYQRSRKADPTSIGKGAGQASTTTE
jgi:UDP-glucose 4-epimerase